MTRKELTHFIREEAMKLAIEDLKKRANKPVAAPIIKREFTEQELDEILFNGGEASENKKPITIKESVNKVTVTTSEIKEFESSFKEKVSPLVIFDKQENGYSLFLYKGEEGMEARVSGKIKINAANEIIWRFSLQNGADIKASLKLDDNNYTLVTKIYEFFQAWQKSWIEKLSGSNNLSNESPSQAPEPPVSTSPAAPAVPATPGIPAA